MAVFAALGWRTLTKRSGDKPVSRAAKRSKGEEAGAAGTGRPRDPAKVVRPLEFLSTLPTSALKKSLSRSGSTDALLPGAADAAKGLSTDK